MAACDDSGSSSGGGTFQAPDSSFDARQPDPPPPPDAAIPDAADAASSATYLYATSYTAGVIAAFSVNTATGALTAVTGSPFAASPKLWGIHARDGVPALFGVTEVGPKLLSFTIDPSSGVLTPASGSPYTNLLASYGLTTDPTSSFLYVNSPNAPNSVAAYRIEPTTRALSQLDASPFTGPTGSLSTNAMHPQGKYLYVLSAENDAVHVLSIAPTTGALTEIAGSPFTTGPDAGGYANNPQAAHVDKAGKHLYVVNYAAAKVVTFDIAEDGGALSAVSTQPAGPGSCGVLLHPNGKFLYTGSDVGLHAYTVDGATGLPTVIGGSPFAIDGGYACGLAISPDGRFLYTGAPDNVGTAGKVLVYELDPTTGTPTAKPALAMPVPSDPGLLAMTTLAKP